MSKNPIFQGEKKNLKKPYLKKFFTGQIHCKKISKILAVKSD